MGSHVHRFYEEWHRSSGVNREQEIRDRDILAIDAVRGCDSVFELGCGSGTVLEMIPAHYKAGADISPTAISLAKQTIAPNGHSGIRVELNTVNVDEDDLPWNDETFDGCLAIEVMEHLFDPVHALAELNRITKFGGKLVVTVPNIGYYYYRYHHLISGEVSDFHGNGLIVNEHIRYYGKKSICHLLELAGFEVDEIKGAIKSVIQSKGGQQVAPRGALDVRGLLKTIRPTPINLLGKMNRLFHLWEKYPSVFAIGLVCVATKTATSQHTCNTAIDHQHRTAIDETMNVNSV